MSLRLIPAALLATLTACTPAAGDVAATHGTALQELSKLNPRLQQVVECRLFAGYTDDETARVLGVAERTVRRDWIKARAWLFQALEPVPD